MANSRSRLIRRILYVLLGLVIIGFLATRVIFVNKGPEYVTVKVVKGDVSQTVSLTGTVEAQNRYQLQFPTAGRVQQIFVKEGDFVKAGALLANLEGIDVALQLQSQKAGLRIAQANLAKAVAGPRNEEIDLGQYRIDLAQQDYEAALNNQNNILSLSEQNLFLAETALEQAQVKYNQAQETVNLLANNGLIDRNITSTPYATSMTSSGLYASTNNLISQSGIQNSENPLNGLYQVYVDYQLSQQQQVTMAAEQNRLMETKNLEDAQYGLNQAELNIRQAYQNYEKTLLDYGRASDDLNTGVLKGQIGVQTAQKQLSLTKAPAREVDVAPLKGQIDQAWEGVHLAEYRLGQTQLYAPQDGIITSVNYRPGENISLAQPSFVLDTTSFVVKALVSEADIFKIKLGDMVTMTFDAFDSGKELSGSISEISPAETVVQGVVYYETRIQFDPKNEPVKSGMTANLTVKTDSKNGVLIVPIRAVQYEDNKPYVQVLDKDKKPEKRFVVLGLQSDLDTEIVSGLQEGEEVITLVKNN